LKHIETFGGPGPVSETAMPDLPLKDIFSQCRICESKMIVKLGEVELYFGYALPIYDCNNCGCRFAPHDSSVYELLYSEQHSRYGHYIDYAQSCKALFDRCDLEGLRAKLSQIPKYRFIIEQTECRTPSARILEIGCSRGFLTSYFILGGCDVVGADVSHTAIAAARKAFGDLFMMVDDPIIAAQAPYDIIFHVGTIGCVADPIGMTTRLLNLLKPGGRLLFNAPNRNGLTLENQLWFESAPPPEIVTLFPPGFWHARFLATAQTDETVRFSAPQRNFINLLRRMAGRKWRKPIPIPLKGSGCSLTPPIGHLLKHNLARAVGTVAAWTRFDRFAPRYPTEYGLYVQMTKK
jgi:SAM-dependent methyltransferase